MRRFIQLRRLSRFSFASNCFSSACCFAESLKPKMGVTTTVYERPFDLNPQTDYPWGDEDERKADWAKGWK